MRKPTNPATDLALIAVFAGLIAAFALAPAIPVGALGVPITLQTLAVALTGMVLGPWRGFLATALYVVVGIAGLPVFAGGFGGPGIFSKASVGYLLSFPVAALVIGLLARWFLSRHFKLRWLWLFVAGITGSILIVHPAGIVGMSLIAGLPLEKAAIVDLAYWPGDVIKNILAAGIAVSVHKAFPTLLKVREPQQPSVPETATVR